MAMLSIMALNSWVEGVRAITPSAGRGRAGRHSGRVAQVLGAMSHTRQAHSTPHPGCQTGAQPSQAHPPVLMRSEWRSTPHRPSHRNSSSMLRTATVSASRYTTARVLRCRGGSGCWTRHAPLAAAGAGGQARGHSGHRICVSCTAPCLTALVLRQIENQKLCVDACKALGELLQQQQRAEGRQAA